MNDFPVIGIAMAVPVIHLLLSFYSHLFPLFSGPAFFFLRKNMKQERPHGKGRKQRTLLMPSKIQNETYDFSQAFFTFRKSSPCLFHPLETISPERNEENVTTIVLVPMTGGR